MLEFFESKPEVIVAIFAFALSLVSLLISVINNQRVRIEALIDSLQGEKETVSYTALHIRLTGLLRRRASRRALIAAMLLSWNFQRSDRARSMLLAALLDAKTKYKPTFEAVVQDLTRQFDLYADTVSKQDMERGAKRLAEVLDAIKKGEAVLTNMTNSGANAT